MAEVKIFHDREGQTLTVWFTDPSLEHVSEETGDEVVLMKDRSGRVIGFEKLNFSIPNPIRCTSPSRPRPLERFESLRTKPAVPTRDGPKGSATGRGLADVSFAFGASETSRWRTRRARDGSVGKPL